MIAVSGTIGEESVTILDIDTDGSMVYLVYIDSNQDIKATKRFLGTTSITIANNAMVI